MTTMPDLSQCHAVKFSVHRLMFTQLITKIVEGLQWGTDGTRSSFMIDDLRITAPPTSAKQAWSAHALSTGNQH